MKSHRKRLAVLGTALAWMSAAQSAAFVDVPNAGDGDISTFCLDEQTGALTSGNRVKAASLVMLKSISPTQRHLRAMVHSKPYRVRSTPPALRLMAEASSRSSPVESLRFIGSTLRAAR